MRLVFLGPPGSGKGTQAQRLSQKLCIPFVSVGEMLREAIRKQSEIGIKIKEVIEAGKLAPDPLVIEATNSWLDSIDLLRGFILDGYPRSMAQARALDKILRQANLPLSAAVFFDISEAEVVARLSGRRSCPKCGAVYHLVFNPPGTEGVCDKCASSPLALRADDAPEAVKTRFEQYASATVPLVEYFKQQGRLIKIDAELPIEEVFKRLCQTLKIK